MSKKYPGGLITAGAPAGYSVAFDGTGDYLQSTTASLSGPFTVELWYYRVGTGSNYCFTIGDSSTSTGIEVYIGTTGTVFNAIYSNAAAQVTSTTQLPTANAWTHIALVRDGSNVIKCYLNGVQVTGSYTSSAVFNSVVRIGAEYYSGSVTGSATAYISNFRILNGTALYTAAFTPPTQLLNITNTSLLTCNSPSIVDQSSNNFTVTPNGNAAVSNFTPFPSSDVFYNSATRVMAPSNSAGFNAAYGAAAPGVWTLDQANYYTANRLWPIYDPQFQYTTLMLNGNSPTNVPTWITDVSTNNFAVTPAGDARAAGKSPFSLTTYPNSGSGYFDGVSDYLTVVGSAAFAFGTGDFTIEFWINTSNATLDSFYRRIYMTDGPTGNAVGNFQITLVPTTGVINLWEVSGGLDLLGTTNVADGNWHHVVACRSGTTLRLFVDGAQQNSTTYTTSVTANAGSPRPRIGSYDGTQGDFDGYISNLRVVKGVAVYTGAFTTPTAPLSATQSAGTNISAITGTQTSLLTLQNSQSSNNNSFLDSSSNNFLITRNGNTTQGTFTPFSQTGWSAYFDNSANYRLTVPDSTDLDLTGDFCLEGWFYFSTLSVTQQMVGVGSENAAQNGFILYLSNSNGTVTFYSNGAAVLNTSASFVANQWQHVAVVRSGSGSNNLVVYRNGVSVGTATNTTSFTGLAGNGLCIGQTYTTSYAGTYNGYVSNVRLVKGSPVYTSSFTPPTTPLTPITNTVLLTCQSNRFIDTNTQVAAKTITVTGSPSIQAFSPFYPTTAYNPLTVGGSGYFPGSNSSYIVMANTSAAVTPATNTTPFTIECWVYCTGTSSTVLYSALSSENYGFTLGFGSSVGTYDTTQTPWFGNYTGGWSGIRSTTAITRNAWTHLACVFTGSTCYIYQDGVMRASGGPSTWGVTGSATKVRVGCRPDATTDVFTGFIAGARVVMGSNLYPGGTTFTPPTAPPTAVTNTQLLCNFTNGGIIDATGKNNLETVTNAQISTVQSKWGGSSMYFDGAATTRLFQPNNINYDFGSGDFTIEFWIKTSQTTAGVCIVSKATTGGAANTNWGVFLNLPATNNIGLYASDGTTYQINGVGGGTVTDNNWHHVAATRAGSSFRVFIDGVQVGSTGTWAGTISSTSRPFYVGDNGNGNYFNGYIDDLRITKGVARYTANFTPPTSQLQQQ